MQFFCRKFFLSFNEIKVWVFVILCQKEIDTKAAKKIIH